MHNFIFVIGPPQYQLDDYYIKAEVGQSPTFHFSVTSDSPLTEHVVHNKDGKRVWKFKTTSSRITLQDLEVADSGEYTISCRDDNRLEGKATFELKVSSGKLQVWGSAT